MSVLSKQQLTAIGSNAQLPQDAIFSLPEKVLQFGTGVLLRGLPDYYFDKANKQGVFNGRVLVVKSTGNGSSDEFAEQDGLFTHCIKGVQNDQVVEETIVNASISRVLSAKSNWDDILATAASTDMQLIISNTTEVGIVLDENDNIHNNPPASFPGKLLAWLYKRYTVFNGSTESGVTIVPTELVTDNGTKLKLITLELAKRNNLDAAFIQWLETANDFCNSLVDRIVPGKMPQEQHTATEEKLGYTDSLMIMSEVYSLWAIETSSAVSRERLSFSTVDSGVVIAPNINKFRELKLRLLNGTHTFSCGLAYLAGFDVVKDAMADNSLSLYVYDLMKHEIAACIESIEISQLEAYEFARNVIDRFRNPHIDHRWLSITMNFSGKMKMRNLPLITEYYNRHHEVPQHMAAGFAAYLLFMKGVKQEGGKYYGERNGAAYHINDDEADYYFHLWKDHTPDQVVHKALSREAFWGVDLAALPGFADAVTAYLQQFINGQYAEVLNALHKSKQNAGV